LWVTVQHEPDDLMHVVETVTTVDPSAVRE
jgi:hypothetical protein